MRSAPESMSPRLHRWWRSHARIAGLATLAFVAIGAFSPSLPREGQWLLLGIGLLATGIPHGGVDHRAARPWLQPRLRRSWLLAFVLGYLTIAAVVVLTWSIWPIPSLLAFLLISILHFGRGDAGPKATWPAVLLLGVTPLLGPLVAYRTETAQLFAVLTGSPVTWLSDGLTALQIPLLIAYGSLLILGLPQLPRGSWWQPLLLVAAGFVLPPLFSFGIYFCGWHAPRHIILEVFRESADDPRRGLWRFAGEAAPATLGAMALAGLGWFAWQPGWGGEGALVRTVFIGLAALTVPHMVVHGAGAMIPTRTRRPLQPANTGA